MSMIYSGDRRERGRTVDWRKQLLLILPLLLCLPSTLLLSQDAFLQEKGEGELWTSIGGGSTQGFYDTEGRQRPFDSTRTTFMAITLAASLDYGLLDNLELNISLPISYFRLSSGSTFRTRSILAPAWLGLGATYRLTTSPLRTAVSTQIRIPPGFHDGIYDDPNHPTFLSDGFFQLITSLHLAYSSERFWSKGSFGYNARSEEPADELVYSAEVGLARVEGTGFFASVSGAISTQDPSDTTRPFYAGSNQRLSDMGRVIRIDGGDGHFATIERETYLNLSAGAFVETWKNITLSAQYTIKLYGINTLQMNGLFLGVGYRF